MEKLLETKWTVSRGRETYGYNICSLYVDGDKVASCNGGGYDMEGTVLGEYLTNEFEPYLRYLEANYGSLDTGKGLYGLVIYNKKTGKRVKKVNHKRASDFAVSIDGACGWNSVVQIANAIGLEVSYLRSMRNDGRVYRLTGEAK